jgi:hypothetical protein
VTSQGKPSHKHAICTSFQWTTLFFDMPRMHWLHLNVCTCMTCIDAYNYLAGKEDFYYSMKSIKSYNIIWAGTQMNFLVQFHYKIFSSLGKSVSYTTLNPSLQKLGT